jgi:hypothetical protein
MILQKKCNYITAKCKKQKKLIVVVGATGSNCLEDNKICS